ncbi:hypothetical protein [Paenibacillus senegalensis]|uniref:hypothetical protein n=1 Tax=Paenibacillus senegalensis TaxID=1465766 RepID=UPI0002889671|nr:hypothetical protein [Paenibacillus senegalensis]
MMDVLTAFLTTIDPVWQIAVVVVLACLSGSLLFLFTGRHEQVSDQEFEDFSSFFPQVKPVMHRYSDEQEESDGQAQAQWIEDDYRSGSPSSSANSKSSKSTT